MKFARAYQIVHVCHAGECVRGVTEAAASYKLSLLSFLGLSDRQIAALCTLDDKSRTLKRSFMP